MEVSILLMQQIAQLFIVLLMGYVVVKAGLALRLIVVPIIVLLLLRVFHASDWIADGKAILMTVYLSAITPSCATVTSMAQLYNRDAAHSSALYVLSTLLSIMTMPLMIGLFDMLM